MQALLANVYKAWHQRPFSRRLRQWFHLDEWVEDGVVSALLACLLLTFAFSLNRWSLSPDITRQAVEQGFAVCPPYFQQCTSLYVLQGWPDYSYMVFYMALFGLWIWAVACWANRWTLWLFGSLVALYAWEVIYLFLLTFTRHGNYDYYHLLFGVVALFLPNKRAFSQILFVLLYFFSASVKFHEGWIAGTYFSSLKEGMPLFSREMIPIMSQGVIILELLCSWLLLSSRSVFRYTALILFTLFHVYSGILVGFQYPVTTLPLLWVLFANTYPLQLTPTPKNIAGWMFLMLLFALQLVAETIPGDRKITLEGNELGLYMFDANHQCVSHEGVANEDGKMKIRHTASTRAWYRCDPYATWFRLKHHQCPLSQNNVPWQFDHSINGGPFFRLVDLENVCTTEYHWLQHQAWIKTPEEGAIPVGRSVQNHYW